MANVCDVLVRLLAQAGVKHIFGVPGDAINALTEALRHQDKIKFIHVNHEESGAFAASGQAKLTGRLGVCAGTAGPGAIHLLNGLYDAKCDRAPVLAITGQVETRFMGSAYQQEIDLHGLFKDVCVYNQVVMNPDHFPYIAVHAIQTAIERKGIAHISIPIDIAAKSVAHADKWQAHIPDMRVLPADLRNIDKAAELLNRHDRIAILAGIGCHGAADKIFALAEKLRAPIIHALRAKELFPESHPYSVGGLGNLGVKPATRVIERCDLLLMIGTNFPYTDFLPKHAKVVQIDGDPCQIGKRIPVDVPLVGDAGSIAELLLPTLKAKQKSAFLEEAQAAMKSWKAEMKRHVENGGSPIKPARLAYLVGEAASDTAIFVSDTGEVTAWVARYLQMRSGQRFTVSGMLATMAFGMGAAIGAKLAYPERQVIALVGDGGFSMLMTDFSTAVKYKLPMLIVVFNNRKLGMIQVEQEGRGLPDYETDLHNPDFAEFAKLCGGGGMRVTDPAALQSAIHAGLESDVPFVLDVLVDADEKIIPPVITLAQAVHYGMAKVKERIGS
ncbi:MAG: pyruvate oxidase [Alphaproteobacteria bacterium]|nr:pyruvate oxidase [Alphaproteobacteria bacterium]